MRVQVLADIPRLQDESFFTYQVPLPLQNGVMPGKRVLIPLGNQVAGGSFLRWSRVMKSGI